MTSNAIQHYVTLVRSPLLLAPLIDSFFQEVKPSERNILLGYLVLPIVLYPLSRDYLNTARNTSSIRNFCSERARLLGLQQRINELRTTSSLAIQNSIDCGRLLLQADLTLLYCDQFLIPSLAMQVEIKAAKRLAKLFEPYDVPAIYRQLGVTKL